MTFSYPAIFTRPRGDSDGVLLATFTAPVGEVTKWASIERLNVDGKGHQRLKNQAKVRAIKRFLELDSRNTIPTAITVALRGLDVSSAPETGSCSSIEIPTEETPIGLVIDGQHRLFGMEAFDPELKVNVVALINPSDEEIAFQFLVINNKASKVSTDHLKLLALQYPEAALGERLKSARMTLGRHASLVGVVDNSEDSPFYRAVEWPAEEVPGEQRANLVLPAAVEQSLAVIAQKNLPDLADDDALIEFFFTLWRSVRDAWPSIWVSGSKLLSKVGVVTLTTFVVDDLTPLADRGSIDLADPDEVKNEVDMILADLTPNFWTSEWAAKSLDTSAGRKLVVDALTQVRRNRRRENSWYADVDLIDTPDTGTD
ncbi:MAG: DGQHR domain-containing protein [Nocardioides sp.]